MPNTQPKKSLKRKGFHELKIKDYKSRTKQNEADDPDDWTPEKELLQAIIERAVQDACGGYDAKLTTTQMHVQREARVWLSSNSKQPFSFCWCVEYLVDEPKHMINLIRKGLKEKWNKKYN
jgi:hypothetical protein